MFNAKIEKRISVEYSYIRDRIWDGKKHVYETFKETKAREGKCGKQKD